MKITEVTFPMPPMRAPLKGTRAQANGIVSNARRRGLVKVEPCCVCGAAEAIAHHEDYSRPNTVAWLCRKCHVARHAILEWGTPAANVNMAKRRAAGYVKPILKCIDCSVSTKGGVRCRPCAQIVIRKKESLKRAQKFADHVGIQINCLTFFQ